MLQPEEQGYFVTVVPGVRAGARYSFCLDGQAPVFADPASRFQPEGPHGPSVVVDPEAYEWADDGWGGLGLENQVLYELHVGTFTPEGTWNAAREKLGALAELGITAIEMMPIAEFTGAFGWGYDGASLFAPSRLYGTPDDLRRFVEAAHRLGIGVILDVVYNHLPPDGSVLARFSRYYASTTHTTEWGAGFNYDGHHSGPVRELIVSNAAYWIDEFHFDGLRLDATQDIVDESPVHILERVAGAVRSAANGRDTIVIAENEPQDSRLVRPANLGGYGLDALWNDDFHHAARVALTGRREAYYQDYGGSPQELVSAFKRGFLFQGQRYAWQKKRRGTFAGGVPRAAFVRFLENHDQTANTSRGERLWRETSPGRWRALVAALLLAPGTPMLFQGEEFRSSAPFTFFADYAGELSANVEAGRRTFLAQFPSLATEDGQRAIPRPCERETFEACKLDWAERGRNARTLAMYKDLVALRRRDPVFSRQPEIDGAVLGARAFVLRFFGGGDRDRLLLVNLGEELRPPSSPEPLLAPPDLGGWTVCWSSEDPRYGGGGTPRIDTDGAYTLLAESAVVLVPAQKEAR